MKRQNREICLICANRWHCPATNKGRGRCKDYKEEETQTSKEEYNLSNKERRCKDDH